MRGFFLSRLVVMHSIETHLVQLAQQIGSVGIQGANAYNAAQAELGLDAVLAQLSLATAEGTSRSLETLSRLSKLNVAHRQIFEKFMTAAVAQLSAVLAEIPEERAAELRGGMVCSINWNLKAQGEFYVNRDRWITAASAICRLVEEHRESIVFTEEGVVFDNDEILKRFSQLVSTVDEIHALEVKQTAERLSRLSASMAVLGSIQK